MSIEVFRDSWGIPHLRAGDSRELAHAQGRNAAFDRAWQIEVERHRSIGTTAAFLGPDAVGWDRFARQVRLDDTARRCYHALDDDTAAWVRSYVDGVNSGLGDGALRAPEFAATGLAPGRWEPWTPLAVWLSHHILFAGFPAKLWREAVARRLGADAIGLFAADGPGTSGSNGWLVPGDRTTTGAALLAGDPHRFIEEPGIYQQIHLSCPEYDVVGLAVPGVPGIAHFGHTGTVAWAITNAMADYQDLYRERLRRRGEVVEAYGPDGWEPASAHLESVEVAGADPVEVEVIETARGPVILTGDSAWAADGAASNSPVSDGPLSDGPASNGPASDGLALDDPALDDPALDDPALDGPALDGPAPGGPAPGGPAPGGLGGSVAGGDGEAAVSLRYPPRVRTELGFEALPRLLRARTVDDVDRAFDRWAEPVNVVLAADADGGLLHRVAGAVPIRHPANGTRVVPAWERKHEWRGWHDPMPRAPVGGLAVMANERGPSEPLGVEFAPPHRADRIRELLEAAPAWSAGAMAAVHTDTFLASAAPLLDLLAKLDDLTPEAAHLRDRLLSWDRRMDAAGAGATAYAAVRSAVVRRLAACPALAALAEPAPCPEIFLPWLALLPRVAYAMETLLTTDRLPGLDQAEQVRAAVEEVAAAGGTRAAWGELHRLTPWRALPGPATGEWHGAGGDHDCVLATSSVPGLTDHFARGPAARYVWDLARRDDSLWVVPFGASGVPGDAHGRDQLPLWLRGELVPVITDWNRLTEERHVH